MEQERKMQEYYSSQVHKSKTIGGIIKNKMQKGKQIDNTKGRIFGQRSTI